MISKARLQQLARKHGTPLFVIDHDALRSAYRQFRKHLPRIQVYYAVKANPDPLIVRTLFKEGASFDVASMPEFMIVYENIKKMPAKKRQDWIWDKIIYANPTKPTDTLEQLNRYKPLVTFDNLEEIHKIKQHAPNAGLALRLKVPNTGAMVELSSKFGALPGEAVDLILEADRLGLTVEGISFHVGSQTTNFENYVQALSLTANIFREARDRGYTKMNLLDIGGGFPAPYDSSVRPFPELAKVINTERFFGHRQGRPRGQDKLLHQRRRLSHLLGRHLRPLQVSGHGLQEGTNEPQLGLRPDLRCPRCRLDGGKPARAEARRPRLQR
jgi:ornithine decarboxylase